MPGCSASVFYTGRRNGFEQRVRSEYIRYTVQAATAPFYRLARETVPTVVGGVRRCFVFCYYYYFSASNADVL